MENSQQKNLIINYLPQELTAKELHVMFVTIGPVNSCNIVKDYKTGFSYGYGFVSFVNPDDSQKAIEKLNGLEIFGKRIKVSYARPPGIDIKDTNLYITNLPREMTEDDLEQIFGKFGNIVTKKILIDKVTGLSRGVGFVRFCTRDSAQEAIKQMDGKILGKEPIGLNIKLAGNNFQNNMRYHIGFNNGMKTNQNHQQDKKPNRQLNHGEPCNLIPHPMRSRNTVPPGINCEKPSNPLPSSPMRSRNTVPPGINCGKPPNPLPSSLMRSRNTVPPGINYGEPCNLMTYPLRSINTVPPGFSIE